MYLDSGNHIIYRNYYDKSLGFSNMSGETTVQPYMNRVPELRKKFLDKHYCRYFYISVLSMYMYSLWYLRTRLNVLSILFM